MHNIMRGVRASAKGGEEGRQTSDLDSERLKGLRRKTFIHERHTLFTKGSRAPNLVPVLRPVLGLS